MTPNNGCRDPNTHMVPCYGCRRPSLSRAMGARDQVGPTLWVERPTGPETHKTQGYGFRSPMEPKTHETPRYGCRSLGWPHATDAKAPQSPRPT